MVLIPPLNMWSGTLLKMLHRTSEKPFLKQSCSYNSARGIIQMGLNSTNHFFCHDGISEESCFGLVPVSVSLNSLLQCPQGLKITSTFRDFKPLNTNARRTTAGENLGLGFLVLDWEILGVMEWNLGRVDFGGEEQWDIMLQTSPSNIAISTRETDPYHLETSCNSRRIQGPTWKLIPFPQPLSALLSTCQNNWLANM